MKSIPLTNEGFFIVDDEDFDVVRQFFWFKHKPYPNGTWYVIRTCDNMKLHRFIMNPEAHELIDHKNGDGLDNRRGNLRICTLSQNQHNRNVNHNNTSGCKGVGFRKNRKGTKNWTAEIMKNNKAIFLGYFYSYDEAKVARLEAEKRLFGEFFTGDLSSITPFS